LNKVVDISEIPQGKDVNFSKHFRDVRQKRLDYYINLMTLASKIKDHPENESSDSEEEVAPSYSNISNAFKVLQYMIDHDEDINFQFSSSNKMQSGSTKEILTKVKQTIELGIFGSKSQLPEELQKDTYDKDTSIGKY